MYTLWCCRVYEWVANVPSFLHIRNLELGAGRLCHALPVSYHTVCLPAPTMSLSMSPAQSDSLCVISPHDRYYERWGLGDQKVLPLSKSGWSSCVHLLKTRKFFTNQMWPLRYPPDLTITRCPWWYGVDQGLPGPSQGTIPSWRPRPTTCQLQRLNCGHVFSFPPMKSCFWYKRMINEGKFYYIYIKHIMKCILYI